MTKLKTNMENQITELFQTSDIKSSAYLLSEGIPLNKFIADNPRKIVFCFLNTEKVKTLLENFWANQASTNPRLLFEKLDYLKDLIHRDY